MEKQNKTKIISLLTIISICQTPWILEAFGIDVGGISTIILTECLMMLLIGFLARSLYWSQGSLKHDEGHGADSLPSAHASNNTIRVDAKLNQVAFNKLDKKQKAELLGKFIKKINESESLKNALNIIPESERFTNKSSDIEYKYSDYLKMYNFIDGNKDGGFSSSTPSPR